MFCVALFSNVITFFFLPIGNHPTNLTGSSLSGSAGNIAHAQTSSTGGRINDAYTANPDIELHGYAKANAARRKKGVANFGGPCSETTTDFNTNSPADSHKHSGSYDKNLQLVGLNTVVPGSDARSGLSTVYEGDRDRGRMSQGDTGECAAKIQSVRVKISLILRVVDLLQV